MLEPNMGLANIIQFAVAPVFLLAGIAGFLNVMSSRLGRIIDRSRVVQRRISNLQDEDKRRSSERELHILIRRTKIINRSIALCTASALLVCMLIVCLFAVGLLNIAMTEIVSAFFVLSMLLLIAALIFFLKEVQLAIRTLKIAEEFSEDDRA